MEEIREGGPESLQRVPAGDFAELRIFELAAFLSRLRGRHTDPAGS